MIKPYQWISRGPIEKLGAGFQVKSMDGNEIALKLFMSILLFRFIFPITSTDQ
jgi:hypothetical protein